MPVARPMTTMALPSVSEALVARAKGYPSHVEKIIELLSGTDREITKSLLKSFKNSVSLLGQENRDVVFAAIKVPWAYADDVADAYGDFIEHLMSAHTIYIRPVCEALVKHFLPAEEEDEASDSKQPLAGVESHQVYRRAHLVLFRVVQVVPACPSTLLDMLKANFPHKRRSAHRHEVYLRNLLTVISYVPVLRDELLHLAIHRMIKIDVEISEQEQNIEEESEDEDDDEDIEDAEGAAEGVDSATGLEAADHALTRDQLVLVVDGVPEEQTPEITTTGPVPILTEMAHKLDRMMCVLFEYLSVQLAPQADDLSPLDRAQRNASLFTLLLSIFEEVILPTHKTKYVQFLLFRMCSVDPDLPAIFVNFLRSKLFNARNSVVDRQASAAYLASFIARHDVASDALAGETLEAMSAWCVKYIATYDDRCLVTHVDVQLHGVFYMVCQSIMYLFCFRHKALLEKYGHAWVRRLRFSKIVQSNLNPLKVVLPHLTAEFARITRREELVYCYSIIDRNDKIFLSTRSANGTEANVLEPFFPFDPYNLRDSACHVINYVQWTTTEGEDPDQQDIMMLESPVEHSSDDFESDGEGNDSDDEQSGEGEDEDEDEDEENDADVDVGSYNSDAVAMSVTPDDAAFLMAFQRNVSTANAGKRKGARF